MNPDLVLINRPGMEELNREGEFFVVPRTGLGTKPDRLVLFIVKALQEFGEFG
jgi:hypothetical protein